MELLLGSQALFLVSRNLLSGTTDSGLILEAVVNVLCRILIEVVPVLTVSPTLLLLVQTERVLGVVTDDHIDPVGTASLSHTVVSHHTSELLSPLTSHLSPLTLHR